MALNLVYLGEPRNNRERALSLITAPTPAPTSIQPGVPVIVGGRPAVSLTASGGATVTRTDGLPAPLTSVTYENGGVGNAAGAATFAFDGTYEFEVTGATTATAQDAAVYIDDNGDLTMTATDNTAYGYVDYPPDYYKRAGILPVRIGA